MRILEASNLKAKGSVSPESELADPHIQQVLKHVAETTSTTVKELEEHILKKMEQFASLHQKAPVLYHSLIKNVAGAEAFKLLEKSVKEEHEEAPTFDAVTFSRLVRRIKVENPSIFPLRNPFTDKPLKSPRFVIIPNDDEEDNKKYADVKTAAATSTGEFIFYKPFLNQCLLYAHVAGVKPKGEKYKEEFPPEWSLIEFLILHEFYHFTHADFHYQEIYKEDPKIINWVGDFRSNYDLVKAGHEPIPMGLYNDLINYDKQKTYREMIDIVKSEFEKLSDPEKRKVEKQLTELGDEHGIQTDDPKKAPGEGEVEEHGKGVSSAAQKGGEGQPGPGPGPGESTSASGKDDKPGSGAGERRAIDWQKIKPKFNWKTLLDRLVKGSVSTEPSYQKAHRRNMVGLHIAKQMGAGAIKPGEVVQPSRDLKICFVVDSSGSMGEHIAKVFAEVRAVLRHMGRVSFHVIEFSNTHKIWEGISEGGKLSFKEPGTRKSVGLDEVFQSRGGGTVFSDSLAADIQLLIKSRTNIIIITDSDITVDKNWENFLSIYTKHRAYTFMILATRDDFEAASKALKHKPDNFSHF